MIRSSATAVTLVPAMAEHAAHVTMLSARELRDLAATINPIARHGTPRRYPLAYRWMNDAAAGWGSSGSARRRPELVKRLIRRGIERRLPEGFDVDRHFTPPYNPWDQRMCLVPDGDLFAALGDGSASIVTDRVASFTEGGLLLESGAELEADAIVTATGLDLVPLGGMELAVDGENVVIPDTLGYKGMMLSDVPNLAFAVGYTNASWTLKADLTCEYVCRLLNHMDEHGYRQVTPRNHDPGLGREPFIDFNSGYVLRAIDRFPKQGARVPWRLHQNYFRDIVALRRGELEDGALSSRGRREPLPLRSPGEVTEWA